MTSIVQNLILGAIQGITEWLPISSKTINTLISFRFFGMPVDEAIRSSIWLHTGSLVAAIIYFRKDILEMIRRLPSYAKRLASGDLAGCDRQITFLIVTTLLAGAIGGPLMVIGLARIGVPAQYVMLAVGVLLIVTGLVQKFASLSPGTRRSTSTKDAVLVGAVQGLSVIPGLSRSGLTVSTLLFRGYSTQYAIRMSFLMSIPFVLGGEIGLGLLGGTSYNASAIAGAFAALVFGIVTIGVLLKIAVRFHFWKFCIVLGLLSLLPLMIERP